MPFFSPAILVVAGSNCSEVTLSDVSNYNVPGNAGNNSDGITVGSFSIQRQLVLKNAFGTVIGSKILLNTEFNATFPITILSGISLQVELILSGYNDSYNLQASKYLVCII